MTELQNKYNGQGLEVLAFPCNQVRRPVVVGRSAHTCAAACPRLLLFWRAAMLASCCARNCCAPASRLRPPARCALVQFGAQEPGSNSEIKSFAERKGFKGPMVRQRGRGGVSLTSK